MKKNFYTTFWVIASVCMLISLYGFAESPALSKVTKPTAWVSYSSNSFIESETKAPGLSRMLPGNFPSVSCTATFTTSISVASSTICVGTSVQLSSTAASQTGGSYSWTFSGAGVFTGTTQPPTDRTPNYRPSGAGISSFTVTVLRSTGCSATATATVSATQPTISAGVQSPVGTICLGTTINLTASGGNTYSWRKNGGDQANSDIAAVGFISTAQNPSYTPLSANLDGTFSVTATAVNSCTNSTTLSLSIQALPSPAIRLDGGDPLPLTICYGQSLILQANPNGSAYSWAGSEGFTSTFRKPTKMFNTVGTATFTVTVTAATGCSNTATASIEVLALPNSYTVTGGGSYCQGGTGVAIGLSNSEAGVSYQLKNDTSPVGNPVSGTGSNISFGLQTAVGSYTVEATRINSGCTANMAGSVSVSIAYPFSALASTVSCSGGSLQLSSTFAPLGAHAWRGPDGFSSNVAKPIVKNMSLAKAGIYTVSVTYNNCISLASVSVNVPAPQTASASSNSTVCVGSSIQLSANTAGIAYQWRGPKSFNSVLKTPNIAATSTTQSGLYSLTVTGSTGCFSTATLSVLVRVCTENRVAVLETDNIDMEIQVWENPTRGKLQVEVSLPEVEVVLLNWIDNKGQTMQHWTSEQAKQLHRLELDVEKYQEGLYLLQVQSQTRQKTLKVWRVN